MSIKNLKSTLLLIGISLISRSSLQAQDMNINQDNWNHITASYLVDLNLDGNEMAGKMSIRMRKDSIIWFSISASIGIQIAKGIIREDSVFFLDLYNRQYYPQSTKDILYDLIGVVPNAVSNIQALSFIQGIFTGSIATGGQFNYENGFGKANITYDSAAQSFPPPSFSIKIESKNPPTAISERPKSNNGLNNIRLDAELKTVRFDAIPSYPFSVPAGYERK